MKTIALTLVAFGLVGLNARAEDAQASKLVGKWEVVKGDAPKGTTIEFTKDGKLTIIVNEGGMTVMLKGSYKLAGDKLTVTKEGDSKELKVKKLTDTELIIEDDKGKTTELKRVKAKE